LLEQIMKFRAYVEPPEPMSGLEVPPEVVEALGGGKRPPVTIALNGHDRLSYGRKREQVLAIEGAKKAETRRQRIEKALAKLRDQESAAGRTGTASIPGES
jgi:uncharacterized protein YdeI (YjbR/CyaY-like superfamily)